MVGDGAGEQVCDTANDRPAQAETASQEPWRAGQVVSISGELHATQQLVSVTQIKELTRGHVVKIRQGQVVFTLKRVRAERSEAATIHIVRVRSNVPQSRLHVRDASRNGHWRWVAPGETFGIARWGRR